MHVSGHHHLTPLQMHEQPAASLVADTWGGGGGGGHDLTKKQQDEDALFVDGERWQKVHTQKRPFQGHNPSDISINHAHV